MSRRREPRQDRLSRFEISLTEHARKRLGMGRGWALADTQVSRRTEPCLAPGERNGAVGAYRVKKQKIGDFEDVRGIAAQTVKERQVMSPHRVKKYGFGVKVDSLKTPGCAYPSVMEQRLRPCN